MGKPEIPQDVDLEICPKPGEIYFHLASYFLVSKEGPEIQAILAEHRLNPDYYDPIMTPLEVRKQFWNKVAADEKGYFTFPPRKLILGHTLESIRVPLNCSLRLREHFVFEETGETLPLKTNLGAPLIHPGSIGPQVYEIYNESSHPLTICLSKIVCPTDVSILTGPCISPEKGNFSVQTRGEISLGKFDDKESKILRRALGAKC